jgi:hypothetical protein
MSKILIIGAIAALQAATILFRKASNNNVLAKTMRRFCNYATSIVTYKILIDITALASVYQFDQRTRAIFNG